MNAVEKLELEPSCEDVAELAEWQRQAGPERMIISPWSPEFKGKYGELGKNGSDRVFIDGSSADGVIVRIQAFDRANRRRSRPGIDSGAERAIKVRRWTLAFLLEHCEGVTVGS